MKNKRLSKKNSKLNSLAFSEKGLSPKLPASNDELSVLTYKNGDTLELCNKNKKIYKETDKKFIEDVGNIVKVKKNMFLEILNTGIPSLKLENKVCDELDYIARKHSKANTINENSRKAFENINEIDKCKCGCNRGKGKLLSLLTNQQKLTFLGPGVLLQFFFNKATLIFLVFVMLIYGIFGTIMNFAGSQAVLDSACDKDVYCKIKILGSDENKQEKGHLYLIQEWLGLVFCVVWIISLRVLKYIGRQKNKIIDNKLRSSSDMAIKVSNLPRGTYQEKQVITYFQQLWQKKQKQLQKRLKEKRRGVVNIDDPPENQQHEGLGIKSIQIIYNVEFARKMVDKIFQLACTVDKFYQSEGSEERNLVKQYSEYVEAKENLIKTYELLLDMRKRFLNDPAFRKLLSSTSCIIEFKKASTQKTLLKLAGAQRTGIQKKIKMVIMDWLNMREEKVLFKGSILKIERAPQPSDILWTNCQKPESLSRTLIILGITFLVMVFSFCIILGLQYLQKYVQKNPAIFKAGVLETVINIATSFALQIINSFLWSMMSYLLDMEYNHTQTQKIISQMNKVLVLTSINIIMLPILSNYLSNQAGFIYGNQGLAGLAFDYHISTLVAVIKSLFETTTMLKIGAIGVKYVRRSIIRFLVQDTKNVDLVKGDDSVNEFYEGPEFDIAENYVTMTTTILHAAFFCRLQPILFFIVTFMILLFFIVNKIKLLRVCKIPSMTEYQVFDNAIYLLGFVPIYFGAGCITLSYFQNLLNPNYPFSFVLPAVAMGLGAIGLFNPKDILNKVVKWIFQNFPCLDLEFYVGAQADEAENDEQSESSISTSQKQENEKNKKKDENNREQNYYKNSNMLSLFGFELTLKGEDENQVEHELKNYCQSFFVPQKRLDQVVEDVASALFNPNFMRTRFSNIGNIEGLLADHADKNKGRWKSEQQNSSKSLNIGLGKENVQ